MKKAIGRIQQLDEESLERFFREYYLLLLEYANFYLFNSQLSEDFVHDVFVEVWEAKNKIKIRVSLKAYILKCLHNKCIQYLRHQSVKQKYKTAIQMKLEEARIMNQSFEGGEITRLFEEEIQSLVEQAIKNIPEKTRTVFLMSRRQYFKNAEIARELNLSEKAIEYHITQALQILRKQLQDYLPCLICSLLMIG